MSIECPEIRSPLTVEEAAAVIEPYFIAVRDVFVREGATKCKRVTLEIAPWIHDSPRHFAATEERGKFMVAAPEFAELPEDTVLAILAHEFGHAVDFLYPGEYLLVDDGELVKMPRVPVGRLDQKATQAHIARTRSWGKRNKDAVERTADAIAEMFTGRTIGYCGPCELQCFDRGVRPRRPGLR